MFNWKINHIDRNLNLLKLAFDTFSKKKRKRKTYNHIFLKTNDLVEII